LLDSGADAAVFPGFASCGEDCNEFSTRLHDAQGQVIPIQTMRDVEIRLLDGSGKLDGPQGASCSLTACDSTNSLFWPFAAVRMEYGF